MKTRHGQRLLVSGLAGVLLAGVAQAWGPHPDITRAALETLGPDTAIIKQLGAETNSLRNNSCMPDWRRSLHRDKQAWFYSDDYLLFPGMAKHMGHMCPEVRETYAPFFQRALQALRTENAFNASRWLGSLIHFVEDTGAPPHAAIVGGDLHKLTENWANPERLHIAGYHASSLGRTDTEALAGLLKRIDGLIEFSKLRYERAKPFAVSGDRAKVDPLLIESAAECARVVADLLLTLGELASNSPVGHDAALRGAVASQAVPGLELLPAKVMLLGTTYATLADAKGVYEFRHLPPGDYTVSVLRPGSELAQTPVKLVARQEVEKAFSLMPDKPEGNMVGNPALNLYWLSPDRPDGWYPNKSKAGEKVWEGDLLPLQAAAQYRLQVTWKDKAAGHVGLRLYGPPPATKPLNELTLAGASEQLDLTASPEMRHAQVIIYSKEAPGNPCRHIAFWQMASGARK